MSQRDAWLEEVQDKYAHGLVAKVSKKKQVLSPEPRPRSPTPISGHWSLLGVSTVFALSAKHCTANQDKKEEMEEEEEQVDKTELLKVRYVPSYITH